MAEQLGIALLPREASKPHQLGADGEVNKTDRFSYPRSRHLLYMYSRS